MTGAGQVHPVAWWVWGLCVAAAATTTTHPVVLAVLGSALLAVVASCADPARRRSTFRTYLWVAAWTVAVRLAFRVVFPTGSGQGVLTLPELSVGPVVLFGVVSREALLSGLTGGLQLAVVILAVGAAHTLADALGLLRHAPSSLAGITTALVVAVSVLPALGRAVLDVRRAARLRGRRPGLRRTVVPVLEATMERSLTLAAAMESRGYGATPAADQPLVASARPRLVQPLALLGAVAAVALATYALFDASWPGWGAPVLAGLAVLLCVVALRTGTTLRRTVYRAERWTPRSVVVAASGAGSLLLLATAVSPRVAHPGPALVPDLSVTALVAALLVAVPLVAAGAVGARADGGQRARGTDHDEPAEAHA
ncbi:ABC-type cobalt transport system, permease component CbiQ [Sanguibacter keddieii DSM 10542]|uniref:ABC-type cobalt transport system, permease component CbiQ n=1 Tax=Sanguibacter keddieii (strain ATCC 51767 / DSM 10542 / NCFB 3025 / ST-74) TaxID=446469 RepID=D1BG19_SANKS|nr:CbiQ family ECF transporter T component [Sanguibacter keddieii]ACZ21530.1 ABC-type cobalt transport system, permease component CbiQ [Sanguibacter keddieii DSM 10542]